MMEADVENEIFPKRVKMICGLIYRDSEALEAALDKLEQLFGPVEFESEHTDFTHTRYYEKEMGAPLIRSFISFTETVLPENLSTIKQETNRLEQILVNESGGRLINIDPGYISLANLVLASTKDFSHRIYLGGGIYGEITLLFENNAFIPLKWTYPDYQTQSALTFFQRVRQTLKDFVLALREKNN